MVVIFEPWDKFGFHAGAYDLETGLNPSKTGATNIFQGVCTRILVVRK
jgi:hypothetical protein